MKLKQKILIAAIAIIFTLFIGYGIEVFDQTPDYEDFCPQNVYQYNNETACVQAGGEWVSDQVGPKPTPIEAQSYCREPQECYTNLSAAQQQHDQIVFITALVIGIITIIISFLISIETISSGLLAGSTLLILYGTIRYWQYAGNIIKFILLGIALALLIWFGYKKLR